LSSSDTLATFCWFHAQIEANEDVLLYLSLVCSIEHLNINYNKQEDS